MKLWTGMLSGELDQAAEDFNRSLAVDQRMAKQDIEGSIAHVKMLGKCHILEDDEAKKIVEGLESLVQELEKGDLKGGANEEDIHSLIENLLMQKIGPLAKKMHTARSRNDQVTTDLRLYLREEVIEIIALLKEYIKSLIKVAEGHVESLMPGYTHLQAAQPVTLAHHMMAYAFMGLRDLDRLKDAKKRMNQSPLGACALAGTTYPIDRLYTADLLGFDGVMDNSMDAVSDRDYVLELQSVLALIGVHLSRLCEELIIWSSQPFHFISLDDAYSTGSSIMPQKKNPDMAELIKGKAAGLIGNMSQAYVLLKGLPLSYAKDLQEDKASLFRSIDTIKQSLKISAGMLTTMKVNEDRLLKAAQEGYLNATDLADYLVEKGVSFRDAHHLAAKVVGECIKKDLTLDRLSIDDYQKVSPLFEEDLYQAIDLGNCLAKRTVMGGPSPKEVKRQIQVLKDRLEIKGEC
ncbi:argininosuccinate lyase [Atopobacter sp. AH10]|uniref:argininosuccinate lyase n=1 Tax=Atopobacter sp. AH10 TaxID=2315861 RepID=UPI000EF1A7FB|nr:argininosuccinate lyase [Atopobacter sp. AH10]RLK62673.1 argininosuccinate lyase [Atopobacter sp. AH10]